MSRRPIPSETGRWRIAYRLLCACNLAYGVTATDARTRPFAVVPPVLPSDAVIAEMQMRSGLQTDTLQTCQTNGNGIDAFLYGETAEAAMLAFRGTLPVRLVTEAGRLSQIMTDWINNARVALVDGRPFGLPGYVHAGFAASLDKLWGDSDGLQQLLPRISAATARGKPLFVTGHSKGGALAGLAALRLAATGRAELRPAGVYTFAAPRAGNREFAAAFARSFPNEAWRFEFQNDIVPQLPPTEGFWFALREALGTIIQPSADSAAVLSLASLSAGFDALNRVGAYESAGRLQFIDWSGDLIDQDVPELQAERSRRLARALITSMPEIGRAHLPMQGFGYMNFLQQRQ